MASKASVLSSVEANSKLTHNLRPPFSGGYEVVRMLAASTGGRRETAHPSLVQTSRFGVNSYHVAILYLVICTDYASTTGVCSSNETVTKVGVNCVG